MKFYTALLCAAMLTLFCSCSTQKNQNGVVTQGIKGNITLSEGNMMPGPDKKEGLKKAVQRTVLFYSVATGSQATGQAPLFESVKTKLVAKVESDSAGFYQCNLKPGRYSVLTLEKSGKFFSGLSNDNTELSPVEVLENAVAVYNIQINYNAVY
jgi:hypothetical protein